MSSKFKFLICFVCFYASTAWADFWKEDIYEAPGAVYTIGDIHADAQALAKILIDLGLMEAKTGEWIGGNATLVLLGDIFDRGSDSRSCLDMMMSLEAQAQKAGGKVFTLLGNHEVLALQGDLRYLNPQDAANYADLEDLARKDLFWNKIEKFALEKRSLWESSRRLGGLGRALKEREFHHFKLFLWSVLSEKSPYGTWLAERPVLLQITGPQLNGETYTFVHAGLSPSWPLEWRKPSSLNKLMFQTISYLRRILEDPNITLMGEMRLLSDISPLWTTEMAGGYFFEKDWVDVKKQFNTTKIFVGHTRTTSEKVEITDPIPGLALVRADTSISSAYGGALSGAKIMGGVVKISYPVRPLSSEHVIPERYLGKNAVLCF